MANNSNINPKPFLKWAGGKSQMLDAIIRYIPDSYDRYIEPFIGGGALFFRLLPQNAIISDSNPELINCYKVVRDSVVDLIQQLKTLPNDEQFYYTIRKQNPDQLSVVNRAARFIYLNKTCFNGLHRVNKKGEFNVPFGYYKNPKICDESNLVAVSQALQNVDIYCSDYLATTQKYARPGDFVFFDPPYDPVSKYADFTRFTQEFFYEEDQVNLAVEFERLADLGAWVLLTNSNTEFTRRLYQQFPYEILDTKRNISSKVSGRNKGEDLVVYATKPEKKTNRNGFRKSETLKVLEYFPSTRFMGSKYSVLDFIWESVKDLDFHSVLDAFSGSGCVSYLFKREGKEVYSNDSLHMAYHTTNALIANNEFQLNSKEISKLLSVNLNSPDFIQRTFKDLYFTDEENAFLDNVRSNIDLLDNDYKKSIALSSLVKSCLKKRPRGIFTYVGNRYYDDRKDLQLSLEEHFRNSLAEYNQAVFSNGLHNQAFNGDIFDLDLSPDLVYMDPPYYSPHSDNDYLRRYHFVEGLVRYWQGVEIQHHTKTKKFKKYPTPFDSKESTYRAFEHLFERYRNSIIVVSYSSNSLPSKSELAHMLKQFKSSVKVYQIGHNYSFGTQYTDDKMANKVQEYLFIGI